MSCSTSLNLNVIILICSLFQAESEFKNSNFGGKSSELLVQCRLPYKSNFRYIVKCMPAGFQWVPDSMKNWFCLFDLEMCDSFQKKFLAILLIRNGYCELVFLLTLLASSQCSITTKVTEYIWKKHWMHWKFCAKAKNHAKNKELTSTQCCFLIQKWH